MQDQAIDGLDQGNVRDAAEKARCATKRATDGLTLARTREEPVTTACTTDELNALVDREPAAESLLGRYFIRLGQLHGACLYAKRCNPQTERRIRETARYISDAEVVATP